MSWNYYWSERAGSSWEAYLRSMDVVRAVNEGTNAASTRITECMSSESRNIVGSVNSLAKSLERSLDQMTREITQVFTWGFSAVLTSLGGMQSTLDALLKIAKTPVQTAAFEQFEIARDAVRKGLYAEGLESVNHAILGVPGISPGYKLEWRFHFLRGLILLGSFDNADTAIINPPEAEQSFLLAARYSRKDFPADAARAMLAAGWATYVQISESGSDKLAKALAYTEEALSLAPSLGEALFQAAKFNMALGMPEKALPLLAKASEQGAVYFAKAAADGDFRRYERELTEFLAGMKARKVEETSLLVQPIASEIRPYATASQQMRQHPAVSHVLSVADEPNAIGLVELADYLREGFQRDQDALQDAVFEIHRVTVKEWEEEVVEKVPTGEMERFEMTIDEPYQEEVVVRPKGWFRSELRQKVSRTRPKQVRGERPVVKELRKKVMRREPERETFELVTGLGQKLLGTDKMLVSNRTFVTYQLLVRTVQAMEDLVRNNPTIQAMDAADRPVTAPFLDQCKKVQDLKWSEVLFPEDSVKVTVQANQSCPEQTIQWELRYHHNVDFCENVFQDGRIVSNNHTWQGLFRADLLAMVDIKTGHTRRDVSIGSLCLSSSINNALKIIREAGFETKEGELGIRATRAICSMIYGFDETEQD